MSVRVMIIGLDGASWDVLNPMIEKGYMPCLKREIEQGRAGVLTSTEPPITPTAWTSFQTGLTPEVHKVLGFRSFTMQEGKLQSTILMSSNLSVKRIWETLSEHGRRVCILNLPLTYPPYPINGVLVSGFPIPSVNTDFTYPQEFKEELLGIIPDFQVMQSGIGAGQMGMRVEDIVARWVKFMSQKTALAHHLLKKEPWDVFMVHIQEGDLMQHYLWPCIDSRDPAHKPEDFPKVAEFYRRMDQEVEKIIEEGRKHGFSVLFLSDHGFQRCTYNVKLNNWLFQNGYLVLKKDAKRVLIALLKRIADLPIMYKFRSKMKHRSSTTNTTNQYLGSVVDYERSVAFVETNATHVAFLHFFKKDAATIDKVLGGLKALVGPTGRRVVREVAEDAGRRGVYKIVLEDGHMGTAIVPTHGPWITEPVPLKNQVGMHHRDGIVILDGSMGACDMPRDIYDVPRIIMALQGFTFTPDGAAKDASGGNGASASKSESDKSEIEKQLKDLGYL